MSPLFGQDRDRMRRFYCRAWAKSCADQPLEPLESQLVAVIRQHPEYHTLLADEDAACAWEPNPQSGTDNPFLHMGMHLALHEQLSTDRPEGIREIYRGLAAAGGDTHTLEHRMMECLGQALWQAQHSGLPPDEAAYFECLRRLTGRRGSN